MKRILSLGIAGVILASILVSQPVEASEEQDVITYIQKAEEYSGALKWQISYEYTKGINYPNMYIFNKTKEYVYKAKSRVVKLYGKTGDQYQRVKATELVYSRAVGYVDAITSGKKIIEKADNFSGLYASNPVGDQTEQAYHDLSSEIRKQAILLYRVYGYSTRHAILDKFKKPGEIELEKTKYTISAKMVLDDMEGLISEGAGDSALTSNITVFLNLLSKVENENAHLRLYERYRTLMQQIPSFSAAEEEVKRTIQNTTSALNNEDLATFTTYLHSDNPNKESYIDEINERFTKYDIKYETDKIELVSLIDGQAAVKHTVKEQNFNEQEFVDSFSEIHYVMKQENNQWKVLDSKVVQTIPLDQIPSPQNPRNDAEKLSTVGANNQLILVTTDGYGTNRAKIQTFERDGSGSWNRLLSTPGYIGKNGFAVTKVEGDGKSPRGKYSIGTAFGRKGNPGTKLPFRNITTDDVWVDDPKSSLYNTWQSKEKTAGQWSSAESMNIPLYDYGFVINYNTERVPYAGSAIFFHVASNYTLGCTGVSEDNMISILRWIDPAKNPVIIQTPANELTNY